MDWCLGFQAVYKGRLLAVGSSGLGEGQRDVVELGKGPEVEFGLLLLGAADECLCASISRGEWSKVYLGLSRVWG